MKTLIRIGLTLCILGLAVCGFLPQSLCCADVIHEENPKAVSCHGSSHTPQPFSEKGDIHSCCCSIVSELPRHFENIFRSTLFFFQDFLQIKFLFLQESIQRFIHSFFLGPPENSFKDFFRVAFSAQAPPSLY